MSRTRITKLGPVAALLLAAGLWLGCGGGNENPVPDDPAPTKTTPRPPPATPPPASTPPATPPSTGAAAGGGAVDGKALYNTYCATCHGPGGKGDGPAAMAANPKPRDFTVGDFKFDTDGNGVAGEDVDLLNIGRNGAAKYGGAALMAPWGSVLNDDQLRAIVDHIRSLKQG